MFFDLPLLKSPEIQQSQAVLLVAFKLLNATDDIFPRRETFADALKLSTSKSIQQFQAGCCVERNKGLVLSVDGGQIRRKLSQHGDGRRLVVDKNSALATRRNLAS